MPNYDYKCLECGHCFQKLLPAGTEETKCLECGHCAQKQITAPQVHFIGKGFYKTDSKPSEKHVKPVPTEAEGSKVEGKADKPAQVKKSEDKKSDSSKSKDKKSED